MHKVGRTCTVLILDLPKTGHEGLLRIAKTQHENAKASSKTGLP
jgi:hypothetical protein